MALRWWKSWHLALRQCTRLTWRYCHWLRVITRRIWWWRWRYRWPTYTWRWTVSSWRRRSHWWTCHSLDKNWEGKLEIEIAHQTRGLWENEKFIWITPVLELLADLFWERRYPTCYPSLRDFFSLNVLRLPKELYEYKKKAGIWVKRFHEKTMVGACTFMVNKHCGGPIAICLIFCLRSRVTSARGVELNNWFRLSSTSKSSTSIKLTLLLLTLLDLLLFPFLLELLFVLPILKRE